MNEEKKTTRIDREGREEIKRIEKRKESEEMKGMEKRKENYREESALSIVSNI